MLDVDAVQVLALLDVQLSCTAWPKRMLVPVTGALKDTVGIGLGGT
jgi:hypothetical protein